MTTRQSHGLLWATLLMCLVLGVGVLLTDRGGAPDRSAPPLGDDEAVAQVVTAAREIVAAARLQRPTGGYSFQSCSTADGVPYQATLYATFAVPQRDPAALLREAADAMVGDGWARSPVVGERFGEKLTRGGVTALINRDDAGSGAGTLRVYGECRNWADHRRDNPAWREVGL